MKQIIIQWTLLILLLAGLSSCRKDRFLIKGEGSNVTNTRTGENFTSVSLSLDANVEIYRDSVFRIELNGQQNILNVIETNISGNTLRIRLERFTSIRKYNPITVKVFMPNLQGMDVSGSGQISCVSDFNSYSLNTDVSGSGHISFRGQIEQSFNAHVSGSGSITNHSGSVCRNAKYDISGSGEIHAEWLMAKDVKAHISGSGDMRIGAEETLAASISGSGDIYYRGSPALSVSISGSGKVRSIN